MTREKAIELAIKACEETWNEKTCKQIREVLEQEPICIAKVEFDEDKLQEIVKEQVARIEITTEQEPKTGHWIKYPHNSGMVVCNQCKGIRRDCRIGYMNYCNRCGAKMQESGEVWEVWE